MKTDSAEPPSSQVSADEPSEGAIRDLLGGFVHGLQRGELQEEGFHQVMRALFTAGKRLQSAAGIDSDLIASLQSLRMDVARSGQRKKALVAVGG
jgi:hypothetical protein